MISRATSLIHHLQHGIVSPVTLAIFALVVIIFINFWMVQTVFTNRYGKSSWINISFSFVDMAIVPYMSNAFSATFDRHLATFFTAAGLFDIGLVLANHYNWIAITKPVIACFIATTTAGFVIVLVQPTFAVFTTTAAVVTFLNAAILTSHMMKHH